ncbi:MAG TPA: ABC-type transport auxiliary lipoprotein family protein [Thermoanaerobaculia bacterium]|nr:ABC-type transport auxiliary lipoprotein family protein [Thermoanaerobaculia bacterium]
MIKRTVVVLSLLAAGCGFFSRTKNNFYSLERIPPAAPIVRTGTGAPVAIDAIELPPGSDRREVVVRKAGQQLDVRPNEQWSAGFQAMVLHTLAFDLAARLPDGMVILPGQAIPTGATRSVSVVFEELAAGPENQVVLDARWVAGGVSHRERIVVSIPSLESAEIANGMSQALAQLADRMAAGL